MIKFLKRQYLNLKFYASPMPSASSKVYKQWMLWKFDIELTQEELEQEIREENAIYEMCAQERKNNPTQEHKKSDRSYETAVITGCL